jgi:RND family efflux transporter MFP subunit
MSDRSSLLDQLHVDRSGKQEGGRGKSNRSSGLLVVIVLLGGLGAVAGWVLYDRHISAAPVHVAPPATVARDSQAGGGSILDANGYVVAQRETTVSAKTTGRIVSLMVEEGQRVAKDQIIAQLDDSNVRADLAEVQAELQQAHATAQASTVSYHDAEPVYARSVELHKAGLISQGVFDTAQSTFNEAANNVAITQRQVGVAEAKLQIAEQEERDMVIRAPFAGVVTAKAAQAGDMVSPVSAGGGFTRTGICTIVDMNSLELDVDISESLIHRIHPHQAARITLNAYPDWNTPGQVIAVIPTADRAKATIKVRIGFKEKDPRILPEMGARVSVLDDTASSPASADEVSRPVVASRAPAPSAAHD